MTKKAKQYRDENIKLKAEINKLTTKIFLMEGDIVHAERKAFDYAKMYHDLWNRIFKKRDKDQYKLFI